MGTAEWLEISRLLNLEKPDAQNHRMDYHNAMENME
jgi:hypothetical protein